MNVRVIRSGQDKDEETIKISTVWTTLIQEQTADAWAMNDEEIIEMVKVKAAEILTYENTHDELDNRVDALEVRVGKVGYSVATVFDNFLPDFYKGEFCIAP